MFTGRFPSELSADWLQPLDDSPPTLAEALAARGWITGGFVGNTRYCSAETGLARGFSHYEDYRLTAGEVALCTAIGRKCLLSALAVDCGVVDWPARKKAAEVSGGFGQWLKQRQGRPYFAFLNFYDAHDPYIASPGYRTCVPASRDDAHLLTHWWCAPKYNLSESQLKLLETSYEDCIRGLDAHVGKMLAQLRQRGELDNTIIIITADHGEHFGDHNLYLHGNSLYEPLLRVPLIVVWPGKIPANVRVKTPVSLAGLPNTLQELTGGQGKFPGGSFAQFLKSGPRVASASQDAEFVAAELPSQAAHPPCHGHSPVAHGAMQCLRSGSLKYIRWGKFEELYDLDRDPHELEDLTQRPDYAGKLARLRAEWQSRYAQRPATGRPDADRYASSP
jgi:arylsulfatase A-like enzyme